MTRQPDRIEVEVRGTVEGVVRKIQLRAYQAMTSGTPVDTGFARASLTPAAGSPVAEQLDRPIDDNAARQDATSRLSENKQRALAIASTYRLAQGRVFLTYRAPYVVFLNEGSSSQAPKKFIERAITAAVLSLG